MTRAGHVTRRREAAGADRAGFLLLVPCPGDRPPASSMSSPPLASDPDPTYTQFTHREQFHALLRDFLARSVLDQDGGDPAREDALVREMGAIVSERDDGHVLERARRRRRGESARREAGFIPGGASINDLSEAIFMATGDDPEAVRCRKAEYQSSAAVIPLSSAARARSRDTIIRKSSNQRWVEFTLGTKG